MVGKPLTAIIPERIRDAHRAGIARAAAGGEPRVIGRTVGLAAVRADGSEFPVQLSLATWTTGEERYFGGIIRDITERKRAEQEFADADQAVNEKARQLEELSGTLAKYLSRQRALIKDVIACEPAGEIKVKGIAYPPEDVPRPRPLQPRRRPPPDGGGATWLQTPAG